MYCPYRIAFVRSKCATASSMANGCRFSSLASVDNCSWFGSHKSIHTRQPSSSRKSGSCAAGQFSTAAFPSRHTRVAIVPGSPSIPVSARPSGHEPGMPSSPLRGSIWPAAVTGSVASGTVR